MALGVACVIVSLGLAQEEGLRGPAEAGEAGSSPLRVLPLPLPDMPNLKASRGWVSPYGPGLQLITDHYKISTTLLGPDLLALLPEFMEAAHQAYNTDLPYPIRPQTRSSVYLFANRRQWEAFTVDVAGPGAAPFSGSTTVPIVSMAQSWRMTWVLSAPWRHWPTRVGTSSAAGTSRSGFPVGWMKAWRPRSSASRGRAGCRDSVQDPMDTDWGPCTTPCPRALCCLWTGCWRAARAR